MVVNLPTTVRTIKISLKASTYTGQHNKEKNRKQMKGPSRLGFEPSVPVVKDAASLDRAATRTNAKCTFTFNA
jgi:hypothetical protein